MVGAAETSVLNHTGDMETERRSKEEGSTLVLAYGLKNSKFLGEKRSVCSAPGWALIILSCEDYRM